MNKISDAKTKPVQPIDLFLAETNLCQRTICSLEKVGILRVRELLQEKPARLLEIDNFGNKSLKEVYSVLAELGFHKKRRKSKTTTVISDRRTSTDPTPQHIRMEKEKLLKERIWNTEPERDEP